MSGSINTTMILALLPELLMLVLAGLVLIFDLIWKEERKRGLGWLSTGGLALIFAISLIFARPGDEAQLIWGDMLRYQPFEFSQYLQ